MSSRSSSWRLVFRVVFLIYTAALLTATHWPGLTVKGPVDRTDLIIHLGAFCTWTCLLYASGLIAAACSTRRLVWVCVAGVCFSVIDETTQPLFSRVFDWWDLGADVVGVLLAGGLIRFFQRFWFRIEGDLSE